jgi:CheY-like chemotaxis protein
LGLSTVYGIIKQHGGWVEVESSPGAGSKFHVYLAVTDKSDERTAEPPIVFTDDARAKGRETVMVVEDEPVLREFITAVLKGHGYSVLHAGDGLEALKICRDNPGKIDLLLTDMVMPNGINGHELAAQMIELRTAIKVLYISGYSQELMENSSRLNLGVNFLPKPFDVSKLLITVRRCLDCESATVASQPAK